MPITSQTLPPTPEAIARPAQGPSRNHLPSLDGLRGFSILLVLICHSAALLSLDFAAREFSYFGHLGVSIFFVVSGLLISWLMIREKEVTGRLSLWDFYVRRALRILPVFWLFLLCVIALKQAHVIVINWKDILRTFTFTHNYPSTVHGPDYYSWWTGHTWSLSMEEQFYLLWPSLFAFLPKRKSMFLAATLALSGPLLRIANYYLFPSLRGLEGWMFHTRLDTLMMGCLGAFLLDMPRWRERIRSVPAEPVLLASFIFLIGLDPYIVGRYEAHSLTRAIVYLILPTIESAFIVASVLVLVAGRTGVGYSLFNQRALVHIGKLSYGIYLWQEFFFKPGSASSPLSLVWRLCAVYLVSVCSFNFLEKPFLNLRKKFRRVAVE